MSAHYAPPTKRGCHTVQECDEVLRHRPEPDVADAWLDERISAMRTAALEEVEPTLHEIVDEEFRPGSEVPISSNLGASYRTKARRKP